MDVVIEFNRSAFKHGVTKFDIMTAVEQFIYDHMLPGEGNTTAEQYLLIGFDTHANLLEIIYKELCKNKMHSILF